MKKLFTLLVLLVAIVTGAWAQNATPDYESYDWASEEAMAAGLAGNTKVSISVATSGGNGNVSGHWYKPLNSAIDGSSSTLGTYLSISSAQQIEKVEIFFCPNGTSNTNLAWAAWGQNVTPSAEVGSNYGTTTSVKSSKSWDNATWQTIDLSDKNAYTVYISRQLKKLTNDGKSISNTGDNQTVNLLGLRVWLKASAPTGPSITDQTIADANYMQGQTTGVAALSVTAQASDANNSLEYQWYSNTTNSTEGGTAIATGTSYTPDVSANGVTYYYCVVTEKDGDSQVVGDPVASNIAKITVSAAEAPTIQVSGAPSGDVKVGTEVTLTASATGTPTPTITWYNGKDESVATKEATELTYTVPTDAAGTYTFYAVASNGVGTNATSATQTIVVKEQVAKPTITPNGAYFQESQEVTIESATEDAVVQYSVDNGATWTTMLSKVITVTQTTTVQAKATKTGCIDSETASATFTLFEKAELASVSAETTWDFTGWTQTLTLSDTTTPTSTDEYTYSDIAIINGSITIPSGFNGDAMMFKGQYPVRSKKAQAGTWTIKTTKPGTLEVTFSDTGSSGTGVKRYLNINGTNTEYYTQRTGSSSDQKTVTVDISAGENVITAMGEDGTTWQAICLYKIVYTPIDVDIVLDESGNNAATIAANDGQTNQKVFVNRNLSTEYYNTIFLPFAMDATQIEAAFGAKAQIATFSGMKSDTQFGFANVTAMEANTGYLVKPAAAVNGFTVEGVTITTAATVTPSSDWIMYGSYDTFGNSASNEVYYFTIDGKVKKLASTGSIKGLRAFMMKGATEQTVKVINSNVELIWGGGSSEPAQARADFFLFLDGGTTTGINSIENGQIDNDAPAYNLAGQKVGKGYKGIVIINGKKVVK